MSEQVIVTEDVLDVLGCDIGERPSGAPGPADLLPWLRGSKREASMLTLDFAAAAERTVEAFVAAERRCCSGIGWEVARTVDGAQLSIQAAPAQLAVLAGVFGVGASQR